ncbi:MAG: nigerose phosphorylase [Verrucomicrobiota bacterium]|nr:nigerose phosphorylase [Verrucomicrobiota bacterium]
MKNLWEISTTECTGDRESIMRRATMYQLANGTMGCRGTLDEFGPDESVGVTLAGLFDRVGAAWREPVNAPNGGYTCVTVDGVELSARAESVVRHRQTLRFADAVFERETVFAVGGKQVTIRSVRFLSADQPNLGVVRFSVACDQDAELTIRTGIDGNIWDLNGPHLPKLSASLRDGVLCTEGKTHEAARRVAVAETVATDLASEEHATAGSRNLRVFRLRAKAGQVCTVTKFFAVFTDQDRHEGAPADAAVAVVRRACDAGYQAAFEAHAAEWRRRWERSDVLIEGDDEAQLALRYSILQLLMVAPVAGSAHSIPARALSGQVYKGAVFWDTEMFMLPFFLHTCPEKAVELLRYRIRTLDGARRKARSEGPGYRGAFYAWESQDTGDDACTYFNIGDPTTGRELRTHFRDKQVHISGDVAIALWEYFAVTGDDRLLLEGGAEVILECARFYYSYAYFKKDRARYEILDVVGPDEYHERVNNNAFTNAVVRETFVIAGAAVAHLEKHHPAALKALVAKLDIAAELAGFADAATRLFVPAPEPATGVIEQFEGYFALRDASLDELKSKMVHPHEYLGAGQGLAVPTKLIKQADVVMMLNLFRARYPAEVLRANWAYYEPRTEHGSSLSASAYAMVAAQLGNLDSAYRYFLKTAEIDLKARYKLYVGTIFIGGSHPAANGGAWMVAVLGFGGLRVEGETVVLNPRLPAKWRTMEFALEHRGDRFRVRLSRDEVTITPHAGNVRDHTFVVAGQKVVCGFGHAVAVKLSRAPAIEVSKVG